MTNNLEHNSSIPHVLKSSDDLAFSSTDSFALFVRQIQSFCEKNEHSFTITGPEVYKRAVSFCKELSQKTGEKILDEKSHQERLQSLVEYSEKIFEHCPESEAVVFFGSAVRGKPNPKDLDIVIFLPHFEPDVIDHRSPVCSASESALSKNFVKFKEKNPLPINDCDAECFPFSAYDPYFTYYDGPLIFVKKAADNSLEVSFFSGKGLFNKAAGELRLYEQIFLAC